MFRIATFSTSPEIMSLNLVRRGGVVFRHLQSRTARVPVINNHARSIYLAANKHLANPIVRSSYAGVIVSGKLVNCYATAAGRPKAHTGRVKAKEATKSTKAKAKKKTTKKTTKKATTPKARKPRKQRELTPEQQEKRKADALRLEIRNLKKLALDPPKRRPSSLYAVALQAKIPEVRKNHPVISEAFKVAVGEVKALPPYEQQVQFPPPPPSAARKVVFCT